MNQLVWTAVEAYRNELLSTNEFNEKLDKIILSLNDQDDFNKINVDELNELFKKIGYDDSELNTIINTVKYIQINSNLAEYKDRLVEIFNKLDNLRLMSNLECKQLIDKCDQLLKTLKEENQFIDEFDFIFEIFDHLHYDIKDISECVKEIDQHNRMIATILYSSSKEENKESFVEENINPSIDEDSNIKNDSKHFDNLGDFFVSNYHNFSSFEVRLLNSLYEEDKEKLDQTFSYIINHEQLSNIISNLNNLKNKRLFVCLISFSDVSIIEEIDILCQKHSINISKLLPTFFISEEKTDIFKDYDDEFYKELSGTYENFVNMVSNFSEKIKLDANKLINEFSALMMASQEDINANLQVLNSYEIPLNLAILPCLKEKSLAQKIDRFIEAGLYDYLKISPSMLLNKDDALFHRIFYAKKNNIPIKRRGLLKDITDTDGLGINYQNYKEKVNTYSIPYFSNIDLYQKALQADINIDNKLFENYFSDLSKYESGKEYIINGIHISKNKAMRIFNSCFEQNEASDQYEFSALRKKIDLIRNVIFSIVSDLILDESDVKDLVVTLLKDLGADKLQETYKLQYNPLEVLCANFDVDLNSVLEFESTKRNGV